MKSQNATQLVIGSIHLDVVRKKIKNLRLSVHPPDGRVRLAVPLRLNDETIRLFVISKIGWIKKHQSKIESQDLQPKKEYVSGESHYFFGNRYILNVICHDSRPKAEIRNETCIDLYVRAGSSEAQRQKALTQLYRDQLKAEIPSLVDKWTSKLGVHIKEWRIKKMRTRWGTCSTRNKRIWINLELAKKPIHCLEFIIVHELTHLMERNHNDRFKALMDSFLPQWREYKRELNQSMIPC